MKTTSYTEGGFFLMSAQFILIISGFLTQIFLGIILGPAAYGIYGVVISVVSVSTVILMGAIPLSVSKFVSANPELGYTIKRKGLSLQFIISSILVLFYAISAPFLAYLLKDPSLTILIQIAALSLLPRALTSVYNMYLNGIHQFKKQAISWSIYGLGKLIFSVILGFFFSVIGAIIGFVIAPTLSLVYGFFASKIKNKVLKNFDVKKMIKLSIVSIIYFICLAFFQSLDLFLMKSMLRDNVLAGYYTAASTLSKLPFNIFGTIALILYPATSRLIQIKDMEKIKILINESMRIVLLMLFPIILLSSSKATELVKIFYTETYAPAGPIFSILILALGIFTIFYVYGSMILVSDKPQVSMFIIFGTVILDYILIRIFIIKYGMIGAAIGTLIGAFIATSIISIYIYRRFKALIKIKSFLKIVFSALVVYSLSFLVPPGKLFTILGIVALVILYYLLLWFIKEITIKDINQFKTIFTRKKEINGLKSEL